MFKAKVLGTFSAAHSLREYKGDCERLHGHNYRVEVAVEAERLDNIGIVMDFRELKNSLKTILQELDHCLLNDLPAFSVANPSAENIAVHIYRRMQATLPAPVRMADVTVWENDGSCVIYSE